MEKGLNSVTRIPSHHIAAPIKPSPMGKVAASSAATGGSPKSSAGLKPTLVQRPTLEVGSVERKKLVVPQSSTPKEPASIFPKKTKSRFVKTKPAIWEKGMNSTRVVMAAATK